MKNILIEKYNTNLDDTYIYIGFMIATILAIFIMPYQMFTLYFIAVAVVFGALALAGLLESYSLMKQINSTK